MNKHRFALYILLTTLVCGAGCRAAKQGPNPLEGWHLYRSQNPKQFDSQIVKDYTNYIQQLPPDERKYVNESNIWFLKDSAGENAVKISIPLHGVWWDHILIYDRDNIRIKTIKYRSGRYRS